MDVIKKQWINGLLDGLVGDLKGVLGFAYSKQKVYFTYLLLTIMQASLSALSVAWISFMAALALLLSFKIC